MESSSMVKIRYLVRELGLLTQTDLFWKREVALLFTLHFSSLLEERSCTSLFQNKSRANICAKN